MRPLNLEEFAEEMRRKGDIRDADLAEEILMLVDLEEEVAEPYSMLCHGLEKYAPTELMDKPKKAVEWLGDRSVMLAEIERLLDESDVLLKTRNTDGAIRELLCRLEDAETELDEIHEEDEIGVMIYDL